MIDVKGRWQSVTDREKWAARGASFVAKTKATKAVWFPPEPAKTAGKAASAAKKTTTRTAKKTTGAAKKTTGTARKKSAAAKTTSGTKKVSAPVRRKKA